MSVKKPLKESMVYKLIDDSEYVRIALAEQGFGLDMLIYDKCPNVRRTMVKHRFGLNKLVYDFD